MSKSNIPICANCKKEMPNLKLYGGKYCYRCFMLLAKVKKSDAK